MWEVFFIFVLAPIGIVLLICWFSYLKTRDKTRMAEKAIEAGCSAEAIEQLRYLSGRKSVKGEVKKAADGSYYAPDGWSAKASLLRRLVWGALCAVIGIGIIVADLTLARYPRAMIVILGALPLAIGVGLLASYYAGRKLYAREIAAEDTAQGETPEKPGTTASPESAGGHATPANACPDAAQAETRPE